MSDRLLNEILKYPEFKANLQLLHDFKNRYNLSSLYTSPKELSNCKGLKFWRLDIIHEVVQFGLHEPFEDEIITELYIGQGDPYDWAPGHLLVETDMDLSISILLPNLSRETGHLTLLLDKEDEAYFLYNKLKQDQDILWYWYGTNPEKEKKRIDEEVKTVLGEIANSSSW